MNTRITFEIKEHEIVYDIIMKLGGEPSDFVTNDCVELGDDEDYVESVINALESANVKYEKI